MAEKLGFIVVLIIGFFLDFSLNFFLIYFLNFNAWASISLSFICVSVINYYANFYIVFKVMRKTSIIEIIKYIVLLSLILSVRILVYDTMISSGTFLGIIYLALIVSFLFSFVLNYAISKFIIFKF